MDLMARQVTIAKALRDAGLLVVEHDGWTTRGSTDFAPVGVVAHHTAGPATGDAPSLQVCIKGRPDLPGPLCQVVLARSGICHVIAAGRANHAGVGSWKGETGNRRFIGIEAENTGRGEPWPAGQVDAYVRACAALLRSIGRGAEWCVGHKEYAPTRKIDPAGLDMGWFRLQVEKRLSDTAGDEDDMTPEQAQQLKDIHTALAEIHRPNHDNLRRVRRLLRLGLRALGVPKAVLDDAENLDGDG